MSERGRTVLIATGDRLFAEATTAYLGRDSEWELVGTALDGLTALAIANRRHPSCVLVIGDLPRLGTSALVGRMRHRSPQTTVVVLGLDEAHDAWSLGPRAAAAEILAALREPPSPTIGSTSDRKRADIARLQSLTSRERSTLKLLADGCTRDEIASRLNLSVHTVRTHTQNLYAKLGVHNRVQLMRFAARHGLVGDDV